MLSSNACSAGGTGEASICRPTYVDREPVARRMPFKCFDTRVYWYACSEYNAEILARMGGFCDYDAIYRWRVPLLRKCAPFKIKHWCARQPYTGWP